MSGCVGFLVVFLLLGQFLSSGASSRPGNEKKQEEPEHVNYNVPEHHHHHEANRQLSTTKRDITTPITTVPNVVPTTPTSPTPILNPNSSPDVTVSPANTIPVTTTNSPPSPPPPPSSLGSSWCVAAPSSSQIALQVALDYACGFGGADCSAIQPGGRCYNPNSVRDHASYAFNSYYQKNPVPNSCNFGGTAVITSTNPSTGTCEFPSTSTSSSILNTTNSVGANVFGSVPVPSTSQALISNNGFSQIHHLIPWLVTSFLATKFP